MATPIHQFDHSFDDDKHEYCQADGLVVPSNTQVLQEVGFYEALEGVEPSIIENKQRIGKGVHKATQLIEQNRLNWSTVPKDLNGYLDAYGSFLEDTGFRSTLVEHRFIAKIHGMPVGMTIDREGWIKYKRKLWLAIGELKCTAQDEDYWGIQTAGYDLGLGEPRPQGDECNGMLMSGQRHTEWYAQGRKRLRFAVQLKPTGRYKLFVYDDPAHYQLFISALSLTWWKINHLSKYRNGFVARSL